MTMPGWNVICDSVIKYDYCSGCAVCGEVSTRGVPEIGDKSPKQ